MFIKIKAFVQKAVSVIMVKRVLAAQLVFAFLAGTFIIMLSRSVKAIKIKDAGSVIELYTVQTDPYKILKLAGCPANAKDLVMVSGENNDIIEISRAFSITVVKDSKTASAVALEGQTVAEALKYNGISLEEKDTVTPAKETIVSKDMTINITTAVYKYTTALKKMAAAKKVTYTREIKPAAVKTKTVKKEVKSEPVVSKSGVISTLTPSSPIELDASGRPVNYKKKLTGKATAYCKGTTCATGVKVRPGYIAVNPKQIPYGTKMYIVSSDGKYNYGYAIAADTGGFAKKGSAIADLYMSSYNQCIQFGRRYIDIYILD